MGITHILVLAKQIVVTPKRPIALEERQLAQKKQFVKAVKENMEK